MGTGRRLGQSAQHERPEAEWIAHTDDAALVEDHQTVGTAHPRQNAPQRLDRIGRRFIRQKRREQFRVGRGRQAGPPTLKLPQQVGWAFSQTVEPVVE